MQQNPHSYQGYPVLPVTDPNTHVPIGWYVPYLSQSFLCEEDAHRAIEMRIAGIAAELQGRLRG